MASSLMIRTSERQAFLTCRQKWSWGWMDNLKTPEPDTKLVFGDFVHQALALYYRKGKKRGPKPAGTFEKLAIEFLGDRKEVIWSDGDYEDIVELGVGMLERYVDFWKNHHQHPDSEYEVISSEQTFKVPMGVIGGIKCWYVGTIDGVWRHIPTKKMRFAEHKTAASISQDALPMDEQVGAYWTFGPRWLRLKGMLKANEKLDGILYNWLRKAVPNPEQATDALGRNINKDGSVSKRQPPPYFARQLTFRGAAEAEAVKRRVRQQVAEMIEARANPDKIYKNPGPQFMPNCKFCSFRDMCELHETGNHWEPFRDEAFVVWDPYAAHELPERR